ncbi:TPA: hypothetical protein ACH3X1_001446 [Trebouxia sp. C0004]
MDQDKRPEFSSAPWDEINSDAKHALTLMFACKVRDRPMAWQALEHPWFSELYPDVSVPHVMQATGPTSRNSERPAARGRSKSAKHVRTGPPVLAKRSLSARRATGKRAQNEEA